MSRIPFDRVMNFVAYRFGVLPDEIRGPSRKRNLVNARAVLCRVLRDRGVSYPVAARMIGRSDHSTAINLVGSFETRCRYYPKVGDTYQAIREREGRA